MTIAGKDGKESDVNDEGKITLRFSCNECTSKFVYKNSLAKHIKTFHETFEYNCDICGRVFARQDSVSRHVRSVHTLVKSTYSCDYCGNEFRYKSNLVKHNRNYHTEKTSF